MLQRIRSVNNMLVQFHKNVTYKSRVGMPIVVSICNRYGSEVIVEVGSDSYPVIEKCVINLSDDGREFLDLMLHDTLCRVWATDSLR